MITHTKDNCDHCHAKNSIITDFSSGQIVCSSCGVVLDDRIIDETYEGRTFGGENQSGNGKDQTRVGGPINAYSDDNNLGVTIGSTRARDKYSKIRHHTTGNKNNSLQEMFKKVDDLAQKMELSISIVDKSKDLLEKVKNEKKMKGRNIECVIASIFYVACRIVGVPRPINEISNKLGLDKKNVNKCFNSIKRIIMDNNSNGISNNVAGLINNFCNLIENSTELKKVAKDVSELICKNEFIAGRNPNTVAGVSILIASKLIGKNMTKKEITNYTGTTENTINNAYTELLKYKEHIIPEIYKEKSKLVE